MKKSIHKLVEKSIDGDLSSFSELSLALRDLDQKYGINNDHFVLKHDAVIKILNCLKCDRNIASLTQEWASFVKRGYFSGQNCGPINPIEIEFEHLKEIEIVEALNRLDEIGDLVDGIVSDEELDCLIEDLSR